MNTKFDSEAIQKSAPDYLIQYRNGLWVAIREKEGNVWKFVTFYVAAISLIIGLGQKLATTLDFVIDVSVAAAIVGLLTFWGLAIIIDSNSWMSRNLKLIGNIEKLFIPKDEFDRFIPGYYSSPLFRYFPPYKVNFFFLAVLAIIAYLNFILHFPTAESTWRQYLLPAMTVIYVWGFYSVDSLDTSTRKEYFRFYKNAPGVSIKDENGQPVSIGSERFPAEFLEFKVSTVARFKTWAFVAASAVLLLFAGREWLVSNRRYAKYFFILIVLINAVRWAVSHGLAAKLNKIKPPKAGRIEWKDLGSKPLTFGLTVKSVKNLYETFTTGCQWFILLAALSLACWPYRQEFWKVLTPEQ